MVVIILIDQSTNEYFSTDVMDMKMNEFQIESGTVVSPRPHVLLMLPIRDVPTLSRSLRSKFDLLFLRNRAFSKSGKFKVNKTGAPFWCLFPVWKWRNFRDVIHKDRQTA